MTKEQIREREYAAKRDSTTDEDTMEGENTTKGEDEEEEREVKREVKAKEESVEVKAYIAAAATSSNTGVDFRPCILFLQFLCTNRWRVSYKLLGDRF